MLTVKTFVEGPIDANNYLLIDEKSKEAVLVDCSSAREEFIQSIKDSGVQLKYILLTHGHFDHILGVDKFKEEFGLDAYIAKEDLTQVDFVPQMLAMFCGMFSQTVPSFINFVKDGDEFVIGETVIKAISTPGHTNGGICYLADNMLFSGDTLFQGSVGRCDMLEGDFTKLLGSIKEKLFVLPDDTEVYPGHGSKTSIGYEKKYNEIINL